MTETQDKTRTVFGERRPPDEIANFLTHGAGFLLSLAGAAVLMDMAWSAPTLRLLLACGVYCFSLIGLYGASTLSHAFYDLRWRRLFRALDQAFIYVLIAGSFTPFSVVYLWSDWWPLLLVVMWALALLGVCVVLSVRNLSPAGKVTYGLLGWLPVIALPTLSASASTEILTWVFAGGILYTSGTVFLTLDRHVRYFHALWHLFVIGGSIAHFIAILRLVSAAAGYSDLSG